MSKEIFNENIDWIYNNYRPYLIKLFIVTVTIAIMILFLSIYFFFIRILISSLLFVISLLLFTIPFGAIFTYRISPTHIGFSKDGIYCKYNKIPQQTSELFSPLEFVKWKDIQYIEQEITHFGIVIAPKSTHDLRDESLKSPIKGGLLIHTNNPGTNFALNNVSKDIMIKVIEKSRTIPNIKQLQF
jgi:hypothetical protein